MMGALDWRVVRKIGLLLLCCEQSTCMPEVKQDPAIRQIEDRVGKLEERLSSLEKDRGNTESMLQEMVWRTQCQPGFRKAMTSIAECCAIGKPCTEDGAISGNLLRADPYGKGYILSMFLPGPPHKVFYFNKKGKIMGDLAAHKKDLQMMLSPIWFNSTRFLVMSHPDPEEKGDQKNLASERGKEIIYLIKNMEFPEHPGSRIVETNDPKTNKILHWIVPFSRPGEPIPKTDKMAGSKLSRSVWVFRVDC